MPWSGSTRRRRAAGDPDAAASTAQRSSTRRAASRNPPERSASHHPGARDDRGTCGQSASSAARASTASATDPSLSLHLAIDPGQGARWSSGSIARCEQMIEAGLLQEVRAPAQHGLRARAQGDEEHRLSAHQSGGRRCRHPCQVRSSQMKADTRRFARRQRTWLRKVEGRAPGWIRPTKRASPERWSGSSKRIENRPQEFAGALIVTWIGALPTRPRAAVSELGARVAETEPEVDGEAVCRRGCRAATGSLCPFNGLTQSTQAAAVSTGSKSGSMSVSNGIEQNPGQHFEHARHRANAAGGRNSGPLSQIQPGHARRRRVPSVVSSISSIFLASGVATHEGRQQYVEGAVQMMLLKPRRRTSGDACAGAGTSQRCQADRDCDRGQHAGERARPSNRSNHVGDSRRLPVTG